MYNTKLFVTKSLVSPEHSLKLSIKISTKEVDKKNHMVRFKMNEHALGIVPLSKF